MFADYLFVLVCIHVIFKKWNSYLNIAFLEVNLRPLLNVKIYLHMFTLRKNIN